MENTQQEGEETHVDPSGEVGVFDDDLSKINWTTLRSCSRAARSNGNSGKV